MEYDTPDQHEDTSIAMRCIFIAVIIVYIHRAIASGGIGWPLAPLVLRHGYASVVTTR
jgi:hypothetical protein